MRVIALVGEANSGKNTVADIIESKYNNVCTIAFADPIKCILSTMFGITVDKVNELKRDTKGKFKYISPIQTYCTGKSMRHLLQRLGTDTREKGDLPESIWRDIALMKLSEMMLNNASIAVVTDLRYIKEYEMLLENFDVEVIQINRECTIHDEHSSEQEWKAIKPNIIIDNNGTIDELAAIVESYMDSE